MTEAAGTIRYMKFTVAVTHETPWYVARCLDVDVVSQGETVDEALANGAAVDSVDSFFP